MSCQERVNATPMAAMLPDTFPSLTQPGSRHCVCLFHLRLPSGAAISLTIAAMLSAANLRWNARRRRWEAVVIQEPGRERV